MNDEIIKKLNIGRFHEKLIEAIKLQTPAGGNVVDTLIRVVPMSKEAAYRRLRGEIQFTLAEVSRISEKLHISIDKLAGLDKKNNYIFHLKQFFTDDPFEKYYDLLQDSLKLYRQVKQEPETVSYFAGATLPHAYYKYKFLSRYAFFKRIYQISYPYGAMKRLKDVIIPQKIVEAQMEMYLESIRVDSYFVIGNDIILSLINDVKYFTAIGLITPDEVVELKEDTMLLLDNMEKMTRDGRFLTTGKKAIIYISDAFFDGNYGCISNAHFKFSTIYLFGINQLNCTDPDFYEYQKEWINSLIAYSTLISGSGKLQGISFFNLQRELLNTI